MVNPEMPLLTTAGARITANIVYNDLLIAQNSFDYIASTTVNPTQSLLNDLGNAWWTAVSTTYLACLAELAVVTELSVFCMTNNTVRTATITLSSGNEGTVAQLSLDSMLSAVQSRYTATRGKRGQGRLFIPFVPHTFIEAQEASGLLTSAAKTIYNAFGTALEADVTVSGELWRYSLISPPTPPEDVSTRGSSILTHVTRTELGTQRRRRIGIGM